jgi:hypothetical protein
MPLNNLGSNLLINNFLFRGADLRGAQKLTQQRIEQATGDENTLLPEGLHRPQSWFQGEDLLVVEEENSSAPN